MTLENESSPLLPAENASASAVIPEVQKSELSLEWSIDGSAIALMRGGEPLALVDGADKKGRSKAIAKATPMTDPWDEALYVKLFQPDSRDSQMRKAVALHDKGDYAGARTIYDKLLAANPADTIVLYEAGMSAQAAKDYDGCIDYAKRGIAVKAARPGGLYSLLGGCHDYMGHTDEALAAFEEGVQLDSQDVTLNFNYGSTLARIGETAKAREHLKIAMESRPPYATPRAIYGGILDKEGNAGAALVMYTSFVMLDLTSQFTKQVAPRIFELLKVGATMDAKGKPQVVPVAIKNPDHPDGIAGQALVTAYSEASLLYARKQGARGTDADHAVDALQAFFAAALKKPSPELKASILWPNGLELIEAFSKQRMLEPFLYLVAADAGVSGAREWGQAHKNESLRTLLFLARLKMSSARPQP